MLVPSQDDIEDALALCAQVHDKIDRSSGFRTRVLLDMLVIELSRDLRKAAAAQATATLRKKADR